MRRFEFVEGTSAKFWQVALDGASFTVTWGKIGAAGQTQTKAFASAEKARAEHDKLVAEKTKKGYVEVGAPAAAPPAAAPPAAAQAVAAAAPPAAAPPAAAQAVAAAPPPAVAPPAAAPPAVAQADAAAAPPAAAQAVAAAPPPAAAQAVAAAPPPADEAHVVWTEAARARCTLRPGGRAPEPPAGTPAEHFAAVTRWFATVRKRWHLDRFAPEVRPAADRALAWLAGGDPTPPDVETAAMASVLVGAGGSAPWYPRTRAASMVRRLMALWADAGGLPWTARVLLEIRRYAEAGHQYDLPSEDGLLNYPHVPWAVALRQESSPEGAGGDAWLELRDLLAAGAAEQAAAARAAVAEAWPSLSFAERELVLTAFPYDRDWADEQGETWLAHHEAWTKTRRASFPDQARRRSPALALRILDVLVRAYGRRNELRDRAFDLLDLLGAGAEAVLMLQCERGEWDDTRKNAAEALACIRSAGVARFLAGELMDRVTKSVAAEYMTAHPDLAAPALAAVLAGRGRAADAAGTLLLALDRAHPGLLDAAPLPPAHRTAVEGLRARMRVLPEAAPGELPPVLASPPWTSKKRRPAPAVVEGLSPLPWEERIVWGPREQERVRRPGDAWAKRPGQGFAEMDPRVRAGGVSCPYGYRGQGLFYTFAFSDADALTAWNEWPAAEFRYAGDGLYGAFLARFGLPTLPGFLKNAAVAPVPAVEALSRVDSPRLAGLMAHALAGKAARRHAERWLAAFPEAAAVGLVPLAVGPPGKERRQAEEALRWLTRKAQRPAVEAVAARYGDEAAAAVRDALDADPRELLPAKMPKLPAFWAPEGLPRPALRGREKSLPLAAVAHLGAMLSISTLEAPYVGLEDVRAACDPDSLEAFAWALFQAWLLAGAPPKEVWAFHAVGLLGGDESARRLTALVRAWPGEKAQARAVVGLDVLARIGTDVALMHLHGIAQKLKFKALQEKAGEKIDEIAAERGLAAHELADRLVPDLDLDPDGSRTLDFGPRQFRVGFDEELAPYVKDAAGKALRDLPKPGAADDAEKAKAAADIWKTLKKDAKAIAATQITRLELAMCLRRRWDAEAFRTFLVGHPLVVHLARRLVWGVYEGEQLAATFRVAEDGTFADRNDDGWTLPDGAIVGIPHPLELDAGAGGAWGQVFGDYRIVQPFAQLGRDTYAPTDAERGARTLDRVVDVPVKTGKILGLDARGWRKGPPQDSGGIWTYDKPLPGGVHAELRLFPGLAAEMAYTEPEQKLGEVELVADDPEEGAAPTFGALDPVLFSELVRDLVHLR